MIARIQLPLGSMYLALWLQDSGEWVPLGAALTAQDARQMCIERVRGHLDTLAGRFADELQAINHNVARLCDAPQDADRIDINGRKPALAEDGTLVLPEWRSFPVTLNQSICEALVGLDPEVEDPQSLIADYILNEPLELLAIVARHRPELLGSLAAYMASVHQAHEAAAHALSSEPADGESDNGGAA